MTLAGGLKATPCFQSMDLPDNGIVYRTIILGKTQFIVRPPLALLEIGHNSFFLLACHHHFYMLEEISFVLLQFLTPTSFSLRVVVVCICHTATKRGVLCLAKALTDHVPGCSNSFINVLKMLSSSNWTWGIAGWAKPGPCDLARS